MISLPAVAVPSDFLHRAAAGAGGLMLGWALGVGTGARRARALNELELLRIVKETRRVLPGFWFKRVQAAWVKR